MNTDTGEIAAQKVLVAEDARRRRQFYAGIPSYIRPIDPANLSPRLRAQLEKTGRTQVSRNSPCPCGSHKRFKRCCMTARAGV